MPVVSPWLRSARRLLAEKIGQLQQTLVTLTDRVRQAIAEAVARAVSGVVQETVRAVLDQLHGPLPPHRQIEYEPRNGRFHDPGGLFPGGVPPDDFADERPYGSFADERFHERSYRETAFDDDEPSPEDEPVRTPSRWRSWLALVLQAVAWWLRRGITLPFLAAVGLAFAGVALTWIGGRHLLAASIGTFRSASELLAMAHNTSVGAGTLVGVLAP
jgi:hypothetical protein